MACCFVFIRFHTSLYYMVIGKATFENHSFQFHSDYLCRLLSVLSQCSFSFVLCSSLFLWAQEHTILVGLFFMGVQGFVLLLSFSWINYIFW